MYFSKQCSFVRSTKPLYQRGFTLVEMAIVLVIVGLLLGGVLKGQELVVQARVKALVNDFNNITAAYYTYFDRYHRFPGDDIRTVARWSTAIPAGDGDGTIGTRNTGYLTDTAENALLWKHLRRSGIIGGDVGLTGRSIFPVNAVSGVTGIQEGGFGIANTVICTTNIPTELAELIDNAIDDGNPSTGSLRAAEDASTATAGGVGAAAPTITNYAGQDGPFEVCREL